MQRDYLKGLMTEKHKSGIYLAEKLGVHQETFYRKMRTGSFFVKEAEIISRELGITDPDKLVWVWTTED